MICPLRAGCGLAANPNVAEQVEVRGVYLKGSEEVGDSRMPWLALIAP